MKNIIDISKQNRYGYHLWFEQDENDDTLYTIHADKDFVINYASYNYDPLPIDAEDYDFYHESHNIKGINYSFDPDGGPYMQVGSYTIDGYKLVRIFNRDNKVYFRVAK